MKRQKYSDEGTAPRVLLRFLAAPAVANFDGNAHGGTVMRWIDDAARTCAMRWSRRDSVAVYSDGIHFYRPIHIGDLVEVEARLILTTPRSMHIAVHVRSARPDQEQFQLTTQCMTILVNKNDEGRAHVVTHFEPLSNEDKELDSHARRLVEMRDELRILAPHWPGSWPHGLDVSVRPGH